MFHCDRYCIIQINRKINLKLQSLDESKVCYDETVKKLLLSWQVARILILLALSAGLITWYVVKSEAQVFEPFFRITGLITQLKLSGNSFLSSSLVAKNKETMESDPVVESEAQELFETVILSPTPTTIIVQSTPTLAVVKPIVVKPTAVPIKKTFPYISNSSVLEALNQYRADHQVHQLVEHHSLCEYAEKRVADQIAFGGLDHHQGFTSDFVNGERPTQLQNYPGWTIGENLAYQHCRNMTTDQSFIAESAPALIEWCFDSSTAGHREAQLNTKFNNVCIRNQNGYFVIIFGD